mmetsp:Transcript_66998/g.105368  ORF Transcript_66998/g.105368 Transcript_66998/m.105368 type:complete len:96 (+) Transcript_66998:543-830(+)
MRICRILPVPSIVRTFGRDHFCYGLQPFRGVIVSTQFFAFWFCFVSLWEGTIRQLARPPPSSAPRQFSGDTFFWSFGFLIVNLWLAALWMLSVFA